MTVARTSPAALEAFKHAVMSDYAAQPRYPDGAIIMAAGASMPEFLAAVRHHDPRTTPVVWVREDGAELIMTPRAPRTFTERVLSRFGRLHLDIEVRLPSDSDRVLYRDVRYAHGSRGVARLEQRAFACA